MEWKGEDGRWTGGRMEMQDPRGYEQNMTSCGQLGGNLYPDQTVWQHQC